VTIKQGQLAEQLRRFAGLEDVCMGEVVASPKSLHYRNKITLHSVMDGKVLGYVGDDNRTVVDVEACPLAMEPINELLATLRADKEFRGRLQHRENVTLRWTEQDGALFWVGKPEPGVPDLVQHTTLGELRVPRRSFFQVNDAVATELVTAVTALIAELAPESVVDLYCGVGVFALAAAKSGVKQVLGIENDYRAVRTAEANAAKLELNAEFVSGACAELVRSALGAVDMASTLVVADPPRTGLEKEVVEALYTSRPKDLIYVSCAPDTLGRDIRLLAAEGYSLKRAQVFDMFPRTAHFETLAWLSRE